MTNFIDDNLLVKSYSMGLQHLRKSMPFLQYVLRKDDEINQGVAPNAEVVIPIPSRMTDAEEVVPSANPYQGEDVTPGFARVRINQWDRKGFAVTDSEMNAVASGWLGPQQTACLDALAATITKKVLRASARAAFNTTGTAGTVPFATGFQAAANARRLLNRIGASQMNRFMLLDADADANAIQLPAFVEFQKAGPEALATLKFGELGMKVGFMWANNMYLEDAAFQVNGTVAPGAYLVNGVQAANPISNTGTLIVDTGVGAPTEGTAFTIAGDAQGYVCLAGCTTTLWNISPALKKPTVDNAVITIIGAPLATGGVYQSLAFQQEAIAFASRSDVNMIPAAHANQIIEIPDPMSGLVLQLEVTRQDKRTMIQYSCRYGWAIPRPELIVRILGGTA